MADHGAEMKELLLPLVSPMVFVEGGSFRAGSPIEDLTSPAYRNVDKPRREVKLESFFLARFLVTAEEFSVFLNDARNSSFLVEDAGWIDWRTIELKDGAYMPKVHRERSPAYPVTWPGAQAYCGWLRRKTGIPYRLPSEMEWEFAARGKEARSWPWGNDPPLVYAGTRPKPTASDWSLELDSGEPAPAFRYIIPQDDCIRNYELFGEQWSCTNWDPAVPWLGSPVGSYPKNATPLRVYDLMGYGPGQWCEKRPDWPSPQDSAGILRGKFNVSVAWRPEIRGKAARLFLPEAGKFPMTTPGRVWSREWATNDLFSGMFRVALDANWKETREALKEETNGVIVP